MAPIGQVDGFMRLRTKAATQMQSMGLQSGA
jgi:hypothetical protein